MLEIKKGQKAKYKNTWAYVVLVTEDEVWLSGWRGIKTTVVKKEDITEVKEQSIVRTI